MTMLFNKSLKRNKFQVTNTGFNFLQLKKKKEKRKLYFCLDWQDKFPV